MGHDVTYSSFPTLTPTSDNIAVGAVTTANKVVCRRCIKRLGLDWRDMKYITSTRSKTSILNCYICGWRLTKRRAKSIWY